MIDVVPNAGVIALGKQGENQAVRVTLPNIRAGAGSILLLHQRSDDKKPYPVPVVEADGGIIWTVSSTDTAYPGRGQAELQWLGVNGEVAKSVTYQTNTTRSMAEPGAVPDEPLKPYTQAVAKDAQAAKDAAEAAKEAAQIAKASAGRAETAANTAQGAAAAAENIQQSVGALASQVRGDADKVTLDKAKAQKAAGDALESQQEAGRQATTAQEAATSARTAADRATESKGQAETAKVGAEAAQAKAEEAAQEAQKAAEMAVLYTEQNLTDSQKEQARTNINAADKARQNILIGTETGNPITVDDAFSAPLCGLTVYGKSTQDGTPTPDAPVPIASAGDGGSVEVKVTGKNLLDSARMNPTFSAKGISAKQNSDGSYTISGTPIVDDTIIIWLGGNWDNTVPLFTIPPGSYYTNVWIFCYDGKNRTSKKNAFTLSEPFRVTGVMYDKKYAINERYNFLIAPQLEPGSTATSYSAYREQLLTLPTPNGLPGIPVTSGGNYTDPQGQQWVCDEVDFEKGVKVQRVDKAAFDSTKTLAEQNAILSTPIETPLTPAEIAAYKALTAYAPDTVVQASDGAGLKLDYQRDVNIVIKKLEDAVASMTAT